MAQGIPSFGGPGRGVFIALIILLFALGSMRGCISVVEDGEAGIKITLGNVRDEALGTGIHFYLPMISRVETWNVKVQELKEVASVPSSEGLISTLEVSFLYRVPLDNAPEIRKKIGAGYRREIVVPYVRDAIRSVVSGHPVKALYSEEGRSVISQRMKEILEERLGRRGIVLEDVLLRDVQLPPVFSASIQNKLKTEQESLQKEFEVEKARKDAEIEVERAKGVAESNRIISQSIDQTYLRYLWIQGLKTNEQQVIYVPTESGLPILEAGRSWGDPKFGKPE